MKLSWDIINHINLNLDKYIIYKINKEKKV